MKKSKKTELVTKERLLELYDKRTPSEGFIYLYHTDDSLVRKFHQGCVVKCESSYKKPVEYMGLEAIIRTLMKYKTVYVASEFKRISNNQKKSTVASAILAYSRTMAGIALNVPVSARKGPDYTRIVYNPNMYNDLSVMHKRMTDKDYINVQMFVQYKDVYEHQSLDHVVTIYDHKANEHHFICREIRANIAHEISKAYVIDFTITRLALSEKTAFEDLPRYDGHALREFLNSVKPVETQMLEPTFEEK